MNKKLLILLSSLFVAFFTTTYAQPTISCPGVDAGNDTTLASSSGNCVFLDAQPVAGFQPTTYTVSSIPYNPYPFNVGTSILVAQDDAWGPVVNLPFDFCFYGNNYTQCQAGSNGMLSFDLNAPNSYCPWPINNAIPNPANPLNCIMGPWHDINPSFGGTVFTQMYGVAPCRVFVVSWENNAMFSCTGVTTTQQIAIYETTNIIEVYIRDKPLCATWNGGASILGVHNSNGTQAVVVPGRNYPSQWSAQFEGWRFEPAGLPNYTINWFQVGNPVPIANTDTVTVCPPNCSVSYACVATYTNCNGTQVSVQDTVTIFQNNPNAASNPSFVQPSCFNSNNGTITVTPSGGVPVYTFDWTTLGQTTATVGGLGAGSYPVVITDAVGCILHDTITLVAPTEVIANASSTDALCFSTNTGTAIASPSGGTPGYTYNWSSGSTNQTATGLGLGQYIVTVTDNNGCTALDTVQVAQPTALVPTTTMTPALCFGGASGTATATVTGGTPGYSYLWSPSGQSSAIANNLAAGSHTVTVTDQNGCTSTSTVSVTQPTQMASTITNTNVSCFGGSNGTATVLPSGGTPGYTYSWSPSGATSATANNLSAGTHSCTITDNNGCTLVRSVVVNEPTPLAIVTFNTIETCAGLCDGTANVVASGGTPPYTYVWSNGGTTSQINNLCAGNYSVTVSDALGCVLSGSTVVSANPIPTANAGPDMSFCEGDGGVQLNGSASGGTPPYYYTWTCNTPPCGLSCVNCPNPIANPTDTTVYYLVVTDNNGCSSPPDSMVVNVLPKPIVNAGPDTTICGTPAPCVVLLPSISNGVGPYSYQWSPSAGLNNPNILNPCARPDTTTIYALVVTDQSTGCSSDYTTTDTLSTVTVTVNPVPIANAGPDRVICEGDSAILQSTGTGAGPVYDFQWSPITGLSNYTVPNPYAFPVLTTQYSLVVYSNGCASVADNVTVFVTEIPTVDAGQNRDICAGDSAFLDGQAVVSNQVIPDSIVSYNWTPPAGLSSTTDEDVWASPSQTTWYSLTATTAAGCENTDSVLVTINPSPLVDAGPAMTLCGGTGPWMLNGTINWVNNIPPGDLQNILIEWQPSQYIIGANDIEDVQFETDSTMYFYFTVTFNTCSHTDSVLVTVIDEILAEATADTNVICSGDSVLLTASGGNGGASFQWSPSTGLANPNSASTLAAPNTTTTYTVVLNESGCTGSAEVSVDVIPSPVASFINSFSEGCAPVEVFFTSTSSNDISLTWDFGDGSQNENGGTVTHTYDTPGSYPVTLYSYSTGGCMDSTENALTVVVHDTLVPAFHSNPNYPIELTIPGADILFTDDSQGAVEWIWNFGDGILSTEQNPTHPFTLPGTYFVTLHAQNQFGCAGTVVHGPYIISLPELFIPNVFSPNSDGVNDRFEILYSGNQPFLLTVFDRWGKVSYQTNSKNAHWDGQIEAADAPEGVYYYTLKVGDREYNGNLTLVR